MSDDEGFDRSIDERRDGDFLLLDAATGFFSPAKLAPEMATTGYQMSQVPAICAITLACAVVYAIPRTAMPGAILTTGFLGGAICKHIAWESSARCRSSSVWRSGYSLEAACDCATPARAATRQLLIRQPFSSKT